MKNDIKNDDQYNAGIPDISDASLKAIYAEIGVDFTTGLRIPTVREVKERAANCGCMSCEGTLYNIQSSIRWFATSDTKSGRIFARSNRNVFINRLRELFADGTTKHTGA
jgi:hypothetical protein